MEKHAFASQKFAEIRDELGATSLSVIVRHSDGRKEFFASGEASVEEGRPADEKTIFRIASISKIEIALCFMKQVELGRADPDEDISTYLGYKVRNPYYPDVPITASMLMTQSSSILDADDEDNPQYNDLKGYDGTNGYDFPVSLKRLLTDPTYEYYTERTWAKYKPGTGFCYSNFGAGILASIVECLTGKLFTDYVRELLFSPLSMDASYRADEIMHPEYLGDYYSVEKHEGKIERKLLRTGKSFIKSVYPKFPLGNNYRGPAGGLFTSLMDLAKIMDLFLNRGIYNEVRIFKEETIDSMEQIHFLSNDQADYRAKGYQLKISDAFGPIMRGHTGGAYGINSVFFFNPENDFGVLLIANGVLTKHIIPEFNELFRKTIASSFKIFLPDPWPFEVVINPEGTRALSGRRVIKLHPIAKGVYPLEECAELLGSIPLVTKDLATFKASKHFITVPRFAPLDLKCVASSLARTIETCADGSMIIREEKE